MVEFKNAVSIRRMFPTGLRTLEDGGHWNTLAGQPTDDSELALILARSIVYNQTYEPEAAARAYAWWYESRPFDCGGTTAAALSAASGAAGAAQSVSLSARTAARHSSQANGALMRISPLGIVASAVDADRAAAWARADAVLTHPNPVCQAANSVYVQALAFAIQTGAGPEQTYRFALEAAKRERSCQQLTDVLARAISKPPEDYTTHQGWVLIALQNAFWQLLHADGLEDALVNTVMCGGDTDTNAAIAGALFGAVHGRVGIPVHWMDRVLSCRPIAGLAGVARPRPEAFWPVDSLWLAERLLWIGSNREDVAPPPSAIETSPAIPVVTLSAEQDAEELRRQQRRDRHWNGVIHRINAKFRSADDDLLPALESRDWGRLIRTVRERPMLVNTVYSKGSSTFHVMHELARRNVPVDVVQELVQFGAFRTVKDSTGAIPRDIATKNGLHELGEALEPALERSDPSGSLPFLQEMFHGLLRVFMLGYKVSDKLWLPQLSILTEARDLKIWFMIPGMYGGVEFWLEDGDNTPVLIVESSSRVWGIDMRHRITRDEVILVKEA